MGRKSSRSQSPMSMAKIKDKDNHKKLEHLTIDSMVEVSREDEDEQGFNKRAWYVAKLLKKSLFITKKKDEFLVQYKSLFSKNDPNKPLTEIITGVSFIRPLPPPPAADQTYEVYDVVEAFYRDGWWKGVVSKVEAFEEEEKSKYSVVFENPPEKFKFCSENLRFHSVWDDGKWVRSDKQKRMKGLNFGKGMAVEVNLNGEISQDAWFPAIVLEEVNFNSFLVEYFRSGRTEETIDSFQIRPPPPKVEVEEFDILQCVEAFHDSCWKKGTILTTLTGERYSVYLDSVKQEIQFEHSEIRPHGIWKNGKWVGLKDYVASSAEHSEVVVNVMSSSAGQDHSRSKPCSKRMSGEMDDANENSSVKKSRKILLDIQEDNNDAFGQQDNVSEGTAGEMETENGETEVCASEEAELSTKTDMENRDVMVRTLSIVPVTVDEQAVPICVVENDREGHIENINQSPAIFAQEDGELAMCQEMPFEKCSSFWQHLDSLDVFQILPQKPHFSPLSELNEATREGFAIAHMVNFASLVDKTSQLQVEKPREVFDSYLEALADLEMFGFDVKPVIERIHRLLSIKTRQEELLNESKDIYCKIAECDSEEAELGEEINSILKMISELKERRAVKLSEKAKIDSEINILHVDAHSTRADISNAKLDFESQVTAPW